MAKLIGYSFCVGAIYAVTCGAMLYSIGNCRDVARAAHTAAAHNAKVLTEIKAIVAENRRNIRRLDATIHRAAGSLGVELGN